MEVFKTEFKILQTISHTASGAHAGPGAGAGAGAGTGAGVDELTTQLAEETAQYERLREAAIQQFHLDASLPASKITAYLEEQGPTALEALGSCREACEKLAAELYVRQQGRPQGGKHGVCVDGQVYLFASEQEADVFADGYQTKNFPKCPRLIRPKVDPLLRVPPVVLDQVC